MRSMSNDQRMDLEQWRPRVRYSGTTTQQGTPSNPLGNVDGSDPAGLCSPGEALRRPLVRYSGLAHSSAPPEKQTRS